MFTYEQELTGRLSVRQSQSLCQDADRTVAVMAVRAMELQLQLQEEREAQNRG